MSEINFKTLRGFSSSSNWMSHRQATYGDSYINQTELILWGLVYVIFANVSQYLFSLSRSTSSAIPISHFLSSVFLQNTSPGFGSSNMTFCPGRCKTSCTTFLKHTHTQRPCFFARNINVQIKAFMWRQNKKVRNWPHCLCSFNLNSEMETCSNLVGQICLFQKKSNLASLVFSQWGECIRTILLVLICQMYVVLTHKTTISHIFRLHFVPTDIWSSNWLFWTLDMVSLMQIQSSLIYYLPFFVTICVFKSSLLSNFFGFIHPA